MRQYLQATNTRVTYLRQIGDQVAALGIDPEDWLRGTNLKPQDLVDVTASISLDKYAELITKPIALSGKSGFGLLAGSRLTPGSHGVVGMAASTSRNIHQAMQIVEQFVGLRTGIVDIWTRVVDDMLEVHFEPAPGMGPAANAVSEIAVVAVKSIADDLVMEESACSGLFFNFPKPSHSGLMQDILNRDRKIPIKYDHNWSGFSFPLSVAEQPVSKHDPFVFSEALRICSNEFGMLENKKITSAMLEKLLLDKMSELPDLVDCARAMNMSPRTLHRRLTEEGTSYHQIADSVRCRKALESLRLKKSVKETAYFLGYTDIANFRRAFKRWEGVAPSEWLERIEKLILPPCPRLLPLDSTPPRYLGSTELRRYA